MTRHILQNLLILLLAAICLGLVLLTVLDLIPANASGLMLSEKITVSSSQIYANEENRISVVRGTFQNPTNATVVIEKAMIVASNAEGAEKLIELTGISIPARTDKEIVYSWQEAAAYDRILSITVTVEGEEDLVPNSVSSATVDGFAVVYLILLAIFALLLVWACKVRYYMYQEDTEKAKNNEAA